MTRLRWVCAAVGGVAVVGVFVWGIWFSPLFAVREGSISVMAQSGDVDLGSVVEIADEQIGQPLPRVKTGTIEARILEDPLIQTAAVSRDWPGGLDVVVTPRVPAFAFETDGEYQLVGSDGVVMRSVDEVPEGLFVVETADEKMDDVIATRVLDLWGSLDESIRSQVEVFHVSGSQFTLDLTDGAQVLWGDSSDGDLKAKVLALLMENRPSSVYDVGDPTEPSVR